MSEQTDPEAAAIARDRAIAKHDDLGDLSLVLCKACNEPHVPIEADPDDFVDSDEPGVKRAAFQLDTDEGVGDRWDRVCVYPTRIERGPLGESVTRVDYARHDFESDAYRAWMNELIGVRDEQLPEFEELGVIGYVVPLPNDRGFVTKCAECTDDPDAAQGTIRDDEIYGDEVPYPECYDCGEVTNPEVRS